MALEWAAVGGDVVALDHGRAGGDRGVPAGDVGEALRIDLLPFETGRPWPDRNIGDRIVAGNVFDVGEAAVEYTDRDAWLRRRSVPRRKGPCRGCTSRNDAPAPASARSPTSATSAIRPSANAQVRTWPTTSRSFPPDTSGSRRNSKMLWPVSPSTIAGMRLLGLICRKAGANCSFRVMSIGWARYVSPVSSSMIETLRPFGVFHV